MQLGARLNIVWHCLSLGLHTFFSFFFFFTILMGLLQILNLHVIHIGILHYIFIGYFSLAVSLFSFLVAWLYHCS